MDITEPTPGQSYPIPPNCVIRRSSWFGEAANLPDNPVESKTHVRHAPALRRATSQFTQPSRRKTCSPRARRCWIRIFRRPKRHQIHPDCIEHFISVPELHAPLRVPQDAVRSEVHRHACHASPVQRTRNAHGPRGCGSSGSDEETSTGRDLARYWFATHERVRSRS
jgi:hypothetical protein